MPSSLPVAFAAALLLAGCASTPVPTHHALVDPVAESRPAAAGASRATAAVTVVIVGCSMPASVDRPQLVVSDGGGKVRLLASERWIEPLREAVPRMLARTLSERLDHAIVWRDATHAPVRPDVRVSLEVSEWTSVPGTLAAVEIVWQLRRGSATAVGRARAQRRPLDAGHAALVAAHRQALHAIGLALAQDIEALLRETQR